MEMSFITLGTGNQAIKNLMEYINKVKIDFLNLTERRICDLVYHHNLETSVRVLLLRNFPDAKFCENKTLTKWRNHSAFYRCSLIMSKLRIFNLANISFYAVSKHKCSRKFLNLQYIYWYGW